MKLTIEVNDTFVVSMRNGASVTVPASDIHKDVLANIFEYGLGQKVRDAASGATSAAKEAGEDDAAPFAQAMMEACVASTIVGGEWSQRVAGSGVDEWTRIARSIMRAQMKAKTGSKSAAWATFTGLDDAEQTARIDANIDANRDALAPAVEAKLEEKRKEREAAKAVRSAINIEL